MTSTAFPPPASDQARRADTRPLGKIAAPRTSPTSGGELDTLLSSYLAEDDAPTLGVRCAIDTPVPLAPDFSKADGARREFWSFGRAFARQARLGRTVPPPVAQGAPVTRTRYR